MATLGNFSEVFNNFEANALAIAMVTLAVALLWPNRYERYLPSTLIALAVGTVMASYGSLTRRPSAPYPLTCHRSTCQKQTLVYSFAPLSRRWS